jgi:hypothetical protein
MTKAHDAEQLAFIHEGVTVTVLAQIFGIDHKDVNKRLVGKITPISTKGGIRYRIRDAAPYLIEMKVNPEELLKNLTPSKLPPALQDAFWKALLSRQKYEENRGDLWRTERVYEVMSDMVKTIRLTVQMFSDTVSQQTELTDRQQNIIQTLSDGLLEQVFESMTEKFRDYTPHIDEHGKPLDEDVAISLSEEPAAEEEATDPWED